MAVSAISVQAAPPVQPRPATSAPQQQSPQPNAATTPLPAAATAQFSAEALSAAASTSGASTASPTGAAPKIDPVKQAIKEGNEPLPLLTKQAKHGDLVAKLLLKQIQKKQAVQTQVRAPHTPGV